MLQAIFLSPIEHILAKPPPAAAPAHAAPSPATVDHAPPHCNFITTIMKAGVSVTATNVVVRLALMLPAAGMSEAILSSEQSFTITVVCSSAWVSSLRYRLDNPALPACPGEAQSASWLRSCSSDTELAVI